MPEDIQALYRYILTGEVVDGLTEKLDRAVEVKSFEEFKACV